MSSCAAGRNLGNKSLDTDVSKAGVRVACTRGTPRWQAMLAASSNDQAKLHGTFSRKDEVAGYPSWCSPRSSGTTSPRHSAAPGSRSEMAGLCLMPPRASGCVRRVMRRTLRSRRRLLPATCGCSSRRTSSNHRGRQGRVPVGPTSLLRKMRARADQDRLRLVDPYKSASSGCDDLVPAELHDYAFPLNSNPLVRRAPDNMIDPHVMVVR
jgi:hypothetical protein